MDYLGKGEMLTNRDVNKFVHKIGEEYAFVRIENLFNFSSWNRTNKLQWGKKVFSQPPIVQVLPLKKMREACNFHYRYTSTMTDKIKEKWKKSRKSHCRIFNELICKLWWKISIWSPTNKQDFWLSQTCNFFFKRLLCPPLVTCINGTCLNLLSV